MPNLHYNSNMELLKNHLFVGYCPKRCVIASYCKKTTGGFYYAKFTL